MSLAPSVPRARRRTPPPAPAALSRTQYLGGADAAALAGVDPYRSAYTVWLEKTGQVPLTDTPPSEAAYWGQQLEDLVAREFSQRTGHKVRRASKILIHPVHPFIAGHIDRWVLEGRCPAILECKTTGASHADEWAEDRVPDPYLIQVHHYLAITGATHAYVAALIGGQRFVWRRVERDEALIEHLIALETTFWEQFVLTQTPPPVDAHPATWDAVRRRYPQHTPGTVMDLPDDLGQQLLSRYQAARAQRDAAQRIMDQTLAELQALAQDAETIRWRGAPVATWRTQVRQTLDVEALRRDHPDLAARYTRETTLRPWTWARRKKEG
jgi:putative phage-type endonuclease